MDSIRPRFRELRNELQEIEQNLQSNSISKVEYVEQLASIEPEMERLRNQMLSMTIGTRGYTGGTTFYELDGVIRKDAEYLLFLTRNTEGQYELGPAGSNSFIFWEDHLLKATVQELKEMLNF